MDENGKPSLAATTPPAKQPWERPTLKYVGNVGDIFLGGGGKTSVTAHDPGDGYKPSGGGVDP
jgi:hypothetical protein